MADAADNGARRPAWKEAIAALLLYAAMTLISMQATAPVGRWGDAAPRYDHDHLYYAYTFWNLQKNLVEKPTQLFDGIFLFPTRNALATTDPAFPVMLLAMPVNAAGGSPLLALNSAVFLWLTASAWCMWWVARRWTGCAWAALAAGVVWCYGTHTITSLGRPNLIPPASWPLLVHALMLHRANPSLKRTAAVAGLLVASVSVGWYVTEFTLLLMLAWVASVAVHSRGRVGWRWLLSLGAAGMATGAFLLPLLRVFREVTPVTYGDIDRLLRHRFFPPAMAIPDPATLPGRALDAVHLLPASYGAAYLGLTTFLAIAAAVVFAVRRRGARAILSQWRATPLLALFLAATMLVGIVLAAGPKVWLGRDVWLPLHWLTTLVPPLAFNRFTMRFIMLIQLSLAFGVAWAVREILRNAPPRARAIVATGFAVVVFLDICPFRDVELMEWKDSAVVRRLHERDDIRAVAQVPVRDPYEACLAAMEGTRHGKFVHQANMGVTVVSHVDLSDYFALFPAPEARAAAEWLGIDAILIDRSLFAGELPDAAGGWQRIDQDDRFALYRRDAELPEAARRLLAQLDPATPEPEPTVYDANQLAEGLWRDNMIVTGTSFVSHPGAVCAMPFAPSIDPARHRRLVLRVRLDDAPSRFERCQIFWNGEFMPAQTEGRSRVQPIPADGQWHDIVFDMTGNPAWVWSRDIKGVRIDIVNESGVRGEFGGMRIE